MIKQIFIGAALLAVLGAAAGNAAAAPLVRFKAFEGNVNIAGTQVSLREKNAGKNACTISASDSASLTLPFGATVKSAQLYWAGSGSSVDATVTFAGKTVTAPAERRYTSSVDGYAYFAAAADVTSLMTYMPSGAQSFSFGGLTVANGAPYCSKNPNDNVVLAGFSLLVVYTQKDEKYRTVNLYEGFEAMRNRSVTVAMGDYAPRAAGTDTGRLAYIVWEGDRTGRQRGDTVTYAGAELTNGSFAVNENAFNSKSSVNNDENSYGVDFDIFNLGSLPADKANSKAVFKTADDLVLLSMAALAVPSAPSSDLGIAKTQSGTMRVGETVDYTLAVTNNGPGPDRNFVIEDVLPDQLEYVSAAGTGWACSVSGQKIACTHAGDLANGATATVLIKAKVRTAGEVINTASVRGTNDAVPGNNSSTIKGNASAPVAAGGPYVFTSGPCTPGQAINPNPGTGCNLFAGPVVAGATEPLWVTKAVNNVAQALATSTTKLSLAFSLECNNPTTAANVTPKVGAKVADMLLPACGADGTAPASIPASAAKAFDVSSSIASVQVNFSYLDVGEVTLRVKAGTEIGGAVNFISKPRKFAFVSIKRLDNVANPGSTTLTQPGFAEVGEPFRVVVRALALDGTTTLPNFGNETAADGAKLVDHSLTLDPGTATGPASLIAEAGWQGSGEVARNFQWNELGVVHLRPRMTYLDGGAITADDATRVGRFYPSYFTTETSKGFNCIKRMACPGAAQQAIEQAIYSEQTFTVTLRAFGRNGEIIHFNPPGIPAITLTAVKAAGAPASDVLDGFASPVAEGMERSASFKLALPYDANKPRTSGWTAPTPIYVRATLPEIRAGAGNITISSLRTVPAESVEDGIMVLNGRLLVGNVIGSPLLRTPIPMRAQFWSGTAWENNTAFDDDSLIVAANVQFSSCRRSLRIDATTSSGENCNLSLLQPVANLSLAMPGNGMTTYILAPLKAGISGSADVFVKTTPWLPSTYGRVTFDQYTSPVIYVREMY